MKRVTLKATIDVPDSWTVEQTRRYVEQQLLSSVREIKTLELVPQFKGRCCWCDTDSTAAAEKHEEPHAKWCVHYRKGEQ